MNFWVNYYIPSPYLIWFKSFIKKIQLVGMEKCCEMTVDMIGKLKAQAGLKLDTIVNGLVRMRQTNVLWCTLWLFYSPCLMVLAGTVSERLRGSKNKWSLEVKNFRSLWERWLCGNSIGYAVSTCSSFWCWFVIWYVYLTLKYVKNVCIINRRNCLDFGNWVKLSAD